MKNTKKKILAILVIVVIVFGAFVSVNGLGTKGYIVDSARDQISLGLDIEGGVYVVLEAQDVDDLDAGELKETMDRTKAVIEKRVNAMGLSEPNVTVEGTKRIRVELPGEKDSQTAIDQVGKTAQLKFTLSDGTEVLTGNDIKSSTYGQDTNKGGYAVQVEFSTEGGEKFEEATAQASSGGIEATVKLSEESDTTVDDKSIVIYLDDEIISAPTCSETISGNSCEITGSFTQEEAKNLSALISGGALPIDMEVINSSVQSATIGYQAFDDSLIALGIGLLLVFALMLLFYRGLGLIADIALLLYVILAIWSYIGLGITMTLPGIAAFILSIGMAVDANVIIFARIKEEIAAGRTPRVAVQTGFKMALSTVIDSQVTTFIAAVILYEIGTSSVKGFAITLLVGILLSIFTAVFVTQLFVTLCADSKRFGNNKFFGCNEDGSARTWVKRQFDFIKTRKIYYAISAGIIVLGIAFALIRGFNMGIDFTGGTMMNIDTGKQVEISKVEELLKDYKLDPTIVYGGDENNEIIIRTQVDLDNDTRAEIVEKIAKEFELDKDTALLSSEQFGASVGDELKTNAVKSILLAALGMLIYIIFRFKSWKYGVASIAGILHDALILLAVYAIFGITINNPFIAAILTVVGYSINDTIVVFDRIRENKSDLTCKDTNYVIMNRSVNQTLSRSIMTSLTTLIVMIPMLILVSASISEFVIPLIIGVGVGTYSSICLCSPLCYEFFKSDDLSDYEKKQLARKKASKKKIEVKDAKEK